MIPLLPEVRKALEDEKEHQKEVEVTCTANIDGYTDFVFLNRFGKIHNPQTINRTIRRITIAYNEQEMEAADMEGREPVLIPPFSCHNLRHPNVKPKTKIFYFGKIVFYDFRVLICFSNY